MSDTAPTEVQERIAKLLAKASRAGTTEEAAAFAAKAQEYLERYNLTAADVAETTQSGTGAGRRTDELHRGGFYVYERRVWQAVARLNFCLYFCYDELVERSPAEMQHARVRRYRSSFRRKYRRVSRHKIVGRVVNVRATQALAGYLLQSIERLLRERLRAQTHWDAGYGSEAAQLRSRWAVSWREGAAEAVVRRLEARRRATLDEARRRERERQDQGTGAASTATSLALLTYIDAETDANNDYLYGEGWSARQAARRAEEAAEARRAAEEYTAWAAANPEEARRRDQEQREAARRASRRRGGYGRAEREPDWSAFADGEKAGASLSLDQQAEHQQRRRLA